MKTEYMTLAALLPLRDSLVRRIACIDNGLLFFSGCELYRKKKGDLTRKLRDVEDWITYRQRHRED